MLLFACHFTNASAQTIQGTRFIGYHYLGGKDALEHQSKKDEILQKVIEAESLKH